MAEAPPPVAVAAPAKRPRIAGILNVTEDSFSDGGLHLDPARALDRAFELLDRGADLLDVGAASSRPDARAVPVDEEIRRLDRVVGPLLERGVEVSVDSFAPATQLWAIERGVAWVNDVRGFPDAPVRTALGRARCGLVVMHSVQRTGPATRVDTLLDEVLAGIDSFFAQRLADLAAAGVDRDRIVLDPGMGFFLGRDPAISIAVLRRLRGLRDRFGLRTWICVSRKSFLGQITGRPVPERGAATLAAEIWAAQHGADFIRTHDPGALRDGLVAWRALAGRSADDGPSGTTAEKAFALARPHR